MLKQQCAYTRLFETFITGQPPRFLRGLDTAPRPFIIEPFDKKQTYATGSSFCFDMILIGSATDFLPYVVFAVLLMAQNGLGVQRQPFELQRVDCFQPEMAATGLQNNESSNPVRTNPDEPNPQNWKQLYDAATQSLLFTPIPSRISNPKSQSNQLRLTFITPTRLKFKAEYSMDFNFRNLVFKMLRRVLELTYFYISDTDIDWEFHDLLLAADNVEITERNLRWSDWQHYSNRQKAKIKMGGFVGDLVLEGELAPFMELLAYAELLHVGKGCVFGLGKVGIDLQS